MGEWASKIGSALGGLAVVVVMAGLFFAQCVYPLIRESPSETWTCEI